MIIVGGGFGGLNAAKAFSRHQNVDVLLIDRRNYHLFQPLLYQVATAGLSPADIATPIRSLFSKVKNISVRLANVTSVNTKDSFIQVNSSKLKIGFDYLILSCGAKHSYFGHPEWEMSSPGLKTLEQATEIRRRILFAFEEAEKCEDKKEQAEYLTFIVIGGGPTGVELAGAIGEISRYTLSRDFRQINPKDARVILIEAGAHILSSFAPRLSYRALSDLKQLGVDVRLNQRVTLVSEKGVWLNKEFIAARTTLWAAGVEPSSLNHSLPGERDPQGRIFVEPDLSLANAPHVFVIGDQTHFKNETGRALPGLAPVAMQQGRHAADNILRKINGSPTRAFRYTDKGQMATIGRRRAIVEYGGLKFSGFLAWITWLFVHIFYLIGFKNRVFVFLQWAWSYLTLKRGARLILDRDWRSTR